MLLIIVLTTMVLLTNTSCPPGMLVVYKLSLKTEWDEKTFPKQFPQWRPEAQWSKTVGFSHSSPSPLFNLGSTVSEGVREFAETGSMDTLDMESANKTFLDTIISPPIEQGVGETTTNIFVDTNHTKVSVMTKIVPSPDWFVGLDSLDLCKMGAWLGEVTQEAFPLDAGTDNGFTFTSPNWATDPRGEVFTMTSQFPTHPAGSFNYPHLAKLPTLAVFSLTKLREYHLQDQEKPIDRQEYSTLTATAPSMSSTKLNKTKNNVVDNQRNSGEDILGFVPVESSTNQTTERTHKNTVLSNEIPTIATTIPRYSHRKAKVGLFGSKPSSGFRSSSSVNGYHASTSPENFFKKKYSSNHLRKAQQKIFSGSLSSMPKSDLYQHILAQYNSGGIKIKKKKLRKRRKHKKHRSPRNCRVKGWGSWGACSKSCGIGESVRVRVVTQHPRHGGLPCPALKDYKWCGSARNCKEAYFKW